MAALAQYPDQLVSTVIIADRTKVPANYLAKVLQQLASASLVSGRRGVGGGYRLARSLDEISLIDVVRAVDTVERIQRCPLAENGQAAELCALHKALDIAAAKVIDTLNGVTLRDLLEDPTSKTRPLCGNGSYDNEE